MKAKEIELEDNIRKYFCDLKVGKYFLTMIKKSTKRKKIDNIKFRTSIQKSVQKGNSDAMEHIC